MHGETIKKNYYR